MRIGVSKALQVMTSKRRKYSSSFELRRSRIAACVKGNNGLRSSSYFCGPRNSSISLACETWYTFCSPASHENCSDWNTTTRKMYVALFGSLPANHTHHGAWSLVMAAHLAYSQVSLVTIILLRVDWCTFERSCTRENLSTNMAQGWLAYNGHIRPRDGI